MLHRDWVVGRTGHVAEHNEISARLVNVADFIEAGLTMQQAIDYSAETGTAAWFRQGTYQINTGLNIARNFVRLRGDGCPTIRLDDEGDTLTIHDCEGVEIRGLHLVSSNGNGLVLNNAPRTILENVRSTDTGKSCLVAQDSWWLQADNCIFADPKANYSTSSLVAMHNSEFRHCRFAGGTIGVLADASYNLHFDACDFSGCNVGLLDFSAGMVLTCPYVEACDIGVQIGDENHFVPAIAIKGGYFNIQCGNGRTGIKIVKGAAIELGGGIYFMGDDPIHTSIGIHILNDQINADIAMGKNYYATVSEHVRDERN